MAIPFAAIGVGLQVGGLLAGRSAAKKQKRAMKDAAWKNYQLELTSLHETSKEVNLKAGEEMSERARSAMFQRSRLAVIGSESGIEGNTADRLTRQTYFDEGFDTTMIDKDRQRAQSQIDRERDAAAVRRDAAANGASVPSGLAAGLQIVGSILEGWKTPKTPTQDNSLFGE